MKLKAVFLSCILILSSFANAQVPQEVTEAKTSITEMVALIDQNNFKDLIINYAYIPDAEKAEFVALIESGAIVPPPEVLQEMKTMLNQAFATEGALVDGEVVFTLQDNRPAVFTKDGDTWKLKN